MVDKGRSERVFEVRDMIYLKFQLYRQSSIAIRKQVKLAAKYYAPFEVLQRIGAVAYKLKLPKE